MVKLIHGELIHWQMIRPHAAPSLLTLDTPSSVQLAKVLVRPITHQLWYLFPLIKLHRSCLLSALNLFSKESSLCFTYAPIVYNVLYAWIIIAVYLVYSKGFHQMRCMIFKAISCSSYYLSNGEVLHCLKQDTSVPLPARHRSTGMWYVCIGERNWTYAWLDKEVAYVSLAQHTLVS